MTNSIAIIGLGNQGMAWAQNLRESGWDVQIFLRHESSSIKKVKALQFEPHILGEALSKVSLIALLIPDDAMPSFFKDYGKFLRPGQSLIFAHGFSLHFKTVPWPKDVNWILVAPKGIGSAVRERFTVGSGVPAVLAVENDATQNAWEIAEKIAEGLGSSRVGTYRASAKEEVEADLFSEQALLCGGLPALIAHTYDILVKAGIKPEVAYLECVHEMAFIAKLIQEKGIHATLRMASPTARFGGLQGGERVISSTLRKELESMFKDIRAGTFTKRLEEEAQSGFVNTETDMTALQNSSVEVVGDRVRRRMETNQG